MTTDNASPVSTSKAIRQLAIRGGVVVLAMFVVAAIILAWVMSHVSAARDKLPDAIQWPGQNLFVWLFLLPLLLLPVVGALFVALFAVIRCCSRKDATEVPTLDPHGKGETSIVGPGVAAVLATQFVGFKAKVQALDARLQTLSGALGTVRDALRTAGTDIEGVGNTIKSMDVPKSQQLGIQFPIPGLQNSFGFALPNADLATSRPFGGAGGPGETLATAGQQLYAAGDAVDTVKTGAVDPVEQAVHRFETQLP
jgi:hypothetical protein